MRPEGEGASDNGVAPRVFMYYSYAYRRYVWLGRVVRQVDRLRAHWLRAQAGESSPLGAESYVCIICMRIGVTCAWTDVCM